MKKTISILLMLAFVVQSTSQLWILASFSLNRSTIASTLCVNRMKPVPICKGSCFLEKQLQQHQQEQEDLPDLKPRQVIMHFQMQVVAIPQPTQTLLDISLFSYPVDGFVASGHLHTVFRPPILQA